jgi:hypothetical protein
MFFDEFSFLDFYLKSAASKAPLFAGGLAASHEIMKNKHVPITGQRRSGLF